MNRNVLLAASAAFLVAVCTGCSRPAARTSDVAMVATAPASRSAPDPAAVPIVYGPRYHLPPDHPPLSAEQLQTIVQRAQARCPDGQRIWFIHALANWDAGDHRQASVEVFFTPEAQTSRLRRGRFIWISDRWAELVAMISNSLGGVDDAEGRKAAEGPLPEYWHVSARAEPFAEKLAVPSGSLVPFPRPEGFTEEEVIEIVDFVRTGPHDPNQSPTGWWFPQHLDTALPIHRIKRDGDAIEVWTGVQEDMVAGAGEILRCRKKEDGSFEVLSISQWVS